MFDNSKITMSTLTNGPLIDSILSIFISIPRLVIIIGRHHGWGLKKPWAGTDDWNIVSWNTMIGIWELNSEWACNRCFKRCKLVVKFLIP